MSDFNREACQSVLNEVLEDRRYRRTYYGERNFPDGTGEFYEPEFRKAARNVLHQRADGTLAWRDLLMREAIGATCQTDPEDLRGELLELASLVIEWVEAIDRREGGV